MSSENRPLFRALLESSNSCYIFSIAALATTPYTWQFDRYMTAEYKGFAVIFYIVVAQFLQWPSSAVVWPLLHHSQCFISQGGGGNNTPTILIINYSVPYHILCLSHCIPIISSRQRLPWSPSNLCVHHNNKNHGGGATWYDNSWSVEPMNKAN